nr:MAG TPA: hypothetical protein [Caudoviricetes sp.]
MKLGHKSYILRNCEKAAVYRLSFCFGVFIFV